MNVDFGEPLFESRGANARRKMVRWLNSRQAELVSCHNGSSIFRINTNRTVIVNVNGYFCRIAYPYPNLEQAEIRFLYDKICEYLDRGLREIEDVPLFGNCSIRNPHMTRAIVMINHTDFELCIVKHTNYVKPKQDTQYSIEWRRGQADVIRRSIMTLRMGT